jgi:hypothetical protein
MTKNGIVLSIIAVILAAVYVVYFTDWFRKDGIQIIPTVRPGSASVIPRDPDDVPVHRVSFALDGKYKLTSVKVLVASELATNKYATPLWHLISDSNSVPTKSITYGTPITGMKPALPRARPEPLLANVEYTLMLEAGKTRSQTNFHTTPAVVLRKDQRSP